MELRSFFRSFWPIRTEDEIDDEVFALAYLVPGFSYSIADMTAQERRRHLERAHKQKKREADAHKKRPR
jgi:hypothetical protein